MMDESRSLTVQDDYSDPNHDAEVHNQLTVANETDSKDNTDQMAENDSHSSTGSEAAENTPHDESRSLTVQDDYSDPNHDAEVDNQLTVANETDSKDNTDQMAEKDSHSSTGSEAAGNAPHDESRSLTVQDDYSDPNHDAEVDNQLTVANETDSKDNTDQMAEKDSHSSTGSEAAGNAPHDESRSLTVQDDYSDPNHDAEVDNQLTVANETDSKDNTDQMAEKDSHSSTGSEAAGNSAEEQEAISNSDERKEMSTHADGDKRSATSENVELPILSASSKISSSFELDHPRFGNVTVRRHYFHDSPASSDNETIRENAENLTIRDSNDASQHVQEATIKDGCDEQRVAVSEDKYGIRDQETYFTSKRSSLPATAAAKDSTYFARRDETLVTPNSDKDSAKHSGDDETSEGKSEDSYDEDETHPNVTVEETGMEKCDSFTPEEDPTIMEVESLVETSKPSTQEEEIMRKVITAVTPAVMTSPHQEVDRALEISDYAVIEESFNMRHSLMPTSPLQEEPQGSATFEYIIGTKRNSIPTEKEHASKRKKYSTAHASTQTDNTYRDVGTQTDQEEDGRGSRNIKHEYSYADGDTTFRFYFHKLG